MIPGFIKTQFTNLGNQLFTNNSELQEDYSSTPDIDEIAYNEYENVVDEELPKMIIVASSANIRSGPSTDDGIILAAEKDTVFEATGETSETSSGRIWYEIYLDETHETKGWASEKVIQPLIEENEDESIESEEDVDSNEEVNYNEILDSKEW